MSFVYPWILIVMMIPFIIFVILVLTNKESADRVFSRRALSRLRAGSANVSTRTRNVVMFLAILFMIIALARPVLNEKEQDVDVEGVEIVIALDISASMRSKDSYPSRLGFAKNKIKQMFAAMNPSDSVEVLAFAYSTFMISPFTEDKSILSEMVEGVNEGYINNGSTDFDALAQTVYEQLKDKKPKILVVFSDGGDEKALGDFENIIKENKITLYTVLVGTKKGAPVLDKRGRIVKDSSGQIVMTIVNEALGKIAKDSGGEFMIASNGAADMRSLVDDIRGKFGDKKKGKTKVMQRDEMFVYPLGLAVLLMLLALSSIPEIRRNA